MLLAASSFWSTVIGAVVGGAVSLCTTLLVEGQKRKAAGEAEKRKERSSAQLAARVIALELRDIESVLRVAVGRHPFVWPPTPGFAFDLKAWTDHSAQLGVVIPDDDWDHISAAYSSFAYSNLLGTTNRETAETMLGQTKEAIAKLEAWRASVSLK